MEYKLEDLIDFTEFKKLLADLPKEFTLPTSVIDLDDNSLLEYKFTDICTKFHHVHPVCEQECLISDQYIQTHMDEAKPSVTYRCSHGLIDNAIPIIIKGRHLANLFVGQIVDAEPDLSFFKSQAKRFGFDEEAYLKALAKVPRVTRNQLDRYLVFIKRFAELIAGTGLERLRVIDASRRVQESEERFRTIFDSVNDAVIIQDITTGSVLAANQRACEEFGYSSTEFNRLNFGDLGSEKTCFTKQDALVWMRKAKEGNPQIFEWEAKHREGHLFWIEVNVRRAFIGKQDALVIVTRNISDRKQIEKELKRHREHLEEMVNERTAQLEIAKNRAESADRLKSAFLASMSHELRTPLNSIIGFTGIIINEVVGPLNFEQKKELTMVKASAYHLLSLINDVLDISKIEAGELDVSWDTFNMRDLAERVMEEMSPLADKKGLDLSNVIAPEVGEITSDERRIRQVLINLVNNAIKFTNQGEVMISCRMNKNRLKICVTDTGIGIKKEDMAKLFKPFQQVDTGTARKYEGTGLGLSICKRILDLLGGRIQVDSVYGKGSTFTVYLPKQRRGESK